MRWMRLALILALVPLLAAPGIPRRRVAAAAASYLWEQDFEDNQATCSDLTPPGNFDSGTNTCNSTGFTTMSGTYWMANDDFQDGAIADGEWTANNVICVNFDIASATPNGSAFAMAYGRRLTGSNAPEPFIRYTSASTTTFTLSLQCGGGNNISSGTLNEDTVYAIKAQMDGPNAEGQLWVNGVSQGTCNDGSNGGQSDGWWTNPEDAGVTMDDITVADGACP